MREEAAVGMLSLLHEVVAVGGHSLHKVLALSLLHEDVAAGLLEVDAVGHPAHPHHARRPLGAEKLNSPSSTPFTPPSPPS
jgi:hypothetical protein